MQLGNKPSCSLTMPLNMLASGSDSKCGFGCNCGSARDREKSLKCRNRVPYHGENAVRPTGRFVADQPHFESLMSGEPSSVKKKLNWKIICRTGVFLLPHTWPQTPPLLGLVCKRSKAFCHNVKSNVQTTWFEFCCSTSPIVHALLTLVLHGLFYNFFQVR